MTSSSLPVEGGCRCGRVRFRVSAAPLLTSACHCTGCQHMSSSAFSLTAAIPKGGFELIAGETVIGGLHGAAEHNFCDWCATWMFTRPPGTDAFVNLRPTLLDQPRWNRPYMETYTSEKLDWASTPAVRSFERFPEMDAYPGLIAEYQAQAQD